MSRAPRLWVIDPSVSNPENQGVEEILDGWGGEARIFRPCLEPGSGPAEGTGYETDGVVLMGSAASVLDRPPWMGQLASWTRPIAQGEVRIPLLGICFGHQLVAHVAGGEVGFVRPDRSKLLGVGMSRIEGGRLLPEPSELRVVISHREQVERLPAGWRVTARRPEVAIDGLEHEKLPIFAFQFHPEAREEFSGRAGIDTAEIDRRLRADNRRLLAAFRDAVSNGRP